MPELRRREATLRAELDALDAQLHDAETYLKLTETLDAFRARLSANAKTLTIEQRQQIVRLVVREVLLGDDDVTVRHSIPLPTSGQPSGSLLRSQSQGAQRAINDVFGEHALVHRCHRHKERNVTDLLPERDRDQVRARMRAAWALTDPVSPATGSSCSPPSSTAPGPTPPARSAKASTTR